MSLWTKALHGARALTRRVKFPGRALPVDGLLTFLREQLRAATNQSLFYRIPVEEARQDIVDLTALEPKDRSEIIEKFRVCLERGLRNEPRVDWISRMGGPKPDSSLTSSGTLSTLFLD